MLQTRLVPAREQKSTRLMIVLHGLGDSMAGYEWFPQALNLPWMNYLLVNAPDAYYEGFAWFDIYQNSGVGIKRSRELLFALLDELRGKGFPTGETTIFGFSQGCVLTFELGCRYPHQLAGLVGISGWPHEPGEIMMQLSPQAKRQKFLITHGMADPLIPFRKVKEAFAKLKEGGLQIDWREFNKAHTIAGEEELDVIRKFVQGCYE
jgi:phospholipase/carboxylesterase